MYVGQTMKVAITGHTRGLGLALANVFTKHGHNVIGFSRSNGFDIKDGIEVEADVFINNAYDPVGQTELLKKYIDKWDGTDKLIINIGSKCTLAFINNVEHEGIRKFLDEYTKAKSEQEDIINSRMRVGKPKLLNVVPGVIDTDMASVIQSGKLNAEELADLIYHVVSLKDKISVQQLVVDVPGQDWDDLKFLM